MGIFKVALDDVQVGYPLAVCKSAGDSKGKAEYVCEQGCEGGATAAVAPDNISGVTLICLRRMQIYTPKLIAAIEYHLRV